VLLSTSEAKLSLAGPGSALARGGGAWKEVLAVISGVTLTTDWPLALELALIVSKDRASRGHHKLILYIIYLQSCRSRDPGPEIGAISARRQDLPRHLEPIQMDLRVIASRQLGLY
jgi:hypothetical protein